MVAYQRLPSRMVAALIAVLFASFMPALVVRATTTISVTTTVDDLDTAPGDGICLTAAGKCSLRAAVQTVNALGYGNTIVIPAGTYTLTQPYDANDISAVNGDLDIVGSQTIKGAGMGKTIIQAGATIADAVDRVFDVKTDSAVVKFSGMTIRNGVGVNFGGGIDVSGTSAVALTNVALKGNRAVSGAGIYGQGQLTVTDSLISGNVGGSASGINWAGNLTIKTSTVSGNTSTNPLADGAIRFTRVPNAPASTLIIERSLISGNTAPVAAAVSIGEGNTDTSTAFIRNSTITGNTTTDAGAAVIVVKAPAELTFESATVALNKDPAIDPPSKALVSSKNTIFASNGTRSCLSALTSLGHNLDAGSSCGLHGATDLQGANPRLGALASNGGPTRTIALGATSPAIDAGAGCPTVDQRGNSRPKDGNGDGVKACDIGAFEHAAVSAPPSLPPSASPSAAVPSSTPAVTVAPSTDATGAPTAASTALAEPPGSASPGGSAAPPSPAPSAATVGANAAGGDGSWVLLVLIGLVVAVVAVVGLRRRRPDPMGRA